VSVLAPATALKKRIGIRLRIGFTSGVSISYRVSGRMT
jgi:hypothetical protein